MTKGCGFLELSSKLSTKGILLKKLLVESPYWDVLKV